MTKVRASTAATSRPKGPIKDSAGLRWGFPARLFCGKRPIGADAKLASLPKAQASINARERPLEQKARESSAIIVENRKVVQSQSRQ